MALNRVAQPFYDNAIKEYHDKNYRQILFTSGRAVQCRELTGIGTFANEQIKELANLMFKDGTILNGCNVRSIDKTPKTDNNDAINGLTVGILTMNGGRIFTDGAVFELDFQKYPNFSKDSIPIKLTGKEIIYVEIIDTVVTALEDGTLLDPASGYDNFEAPGAHRLQRIARYISTAHKDYNTPGNNRFPIVELLDGKIIYEASKKAVQNESENKVSTETNILDILSQRTFETSGNYLVNGYKVKSFPCPDNTKVGVTVTPGIAYIGGKRIELQSSFTGYIDKIMVTSVVQGEDKPIEYIKHLDSTGNLVISTDNNGKKLIQRKYKMGMSPVSAVSEVALPVIGKRQLIYNQASISYITGLGGSVNKILKCYVPTSPEVGEGDPETLPITYEEFVEGVDFRFENQGILWLQTGRNPMSLPEGIRGTQFFVTFLYKPNLLSSDYHIEYVSKKDATINIPIVNGVAQIPEHFVNPTIKSVQNPYNSNLNANGETEYQALESNKQWYQEGNKIHVATKTNPDIPIRVVRRSNTNTDNIGISGAVVKTAKLYSEQGVVYYKLDNSYEAKPDYRFHSDTGSIEWLSSNRPPLGEIYLVETEVGQGTYIDYGANPESVLVSFTYENISDIYTNKCHDSYLVIHDNIKINRSEAGGDNLTVSYEVARSRTTSVGLDKSGKIAFYHGTVVDTYNNLTPTIPVDSLVIADLFIKPTSALEYRILSKDNYRMRMTDLKDMFNRVKDIEYNISLNDLEKEAESKLPGQVLRGVFTDAFTNIKKSDNSMVWSFINNTDNQAIPLVTEGKLSPNFKKYSMGLTVNTNKTTAGLYNNVYLLSKNYREEVWLRQPFGTTIRSAAEGLDLMECFPSFAIDPDNDQFIENEIGFVEPDPLAGSIANTSDQNELIRKNVYILKGDSAALVSDGIFNFPTAKNSIITVQFWMYSETNRGMPFSFNGIGTPKPIGANLMFNYNYFGVNSLGSDVTGIPNEELQGYWRQVTCTFKCEADNVTSMDLYINGDKQKMTSVFGAKGLYMAKNIVFGNKIRIGGSFYYPKGYEFKGKIADIRLWNKALTANEIQSTMAKDLNGNEAGLIGWWHEKINNNKIVDSCTNGSRHDLSVIHNGGHTENTNGVIEYETGNFAEIVSGKKAKSSNSNLKNIIDLTAGNVPDNQVELILDPTKSKIVKNAYIGDKNKILNEQGVIDLNKGGIGNVKYWGEHELDAYDIKKTWYEKVITQEDEILGEFLTDIKSISNLRRRIIQVTGKGFLPNTDLISITFDGIPVQLCKIAGWNATTDGSPTIYNNTSDRYWKTNANGEFKCGFVIPEGVPIGVREVKLTAPGNIVLKALYWGAGMKASKLTLTQTNETITWEPRTAVIGQEYQTKDGWILLDGWTCRSRCGTTPLCQTFYVNDSSLTKPVINDIGINSDVYLTSADIFFRTAGECEDCIAGFVELTDSGVPKSDSGAGPSRFVGGVNVFDSRTINMTVGDPSRGTAAHNLKWPNLVPLQGGKGYGFIVGSTDGNTTMWIASIENSSKNVDIATGVSVISEPDRGILLSSPNGQTWAVFHYEDMKYTFYIANFFADARLANAPSVMRPSKVFSNTGKVSYVEYNEIDIRNKSSNSLSEMNFFIYEINAKNSTDGSGFIVYEYSQLNNNTGEWSNWTEFTPGSTVFLKISAQKIKVRACLYSYNPYSTPMLSKDAFITCGQFVLPSKYTSITGAVGKWNMAEIYIDKFMDENLSKVELYVSPDQGYTWKHMNAPFNITPVMQNNTRYNNETINQYHYKLKLVVDTPVIEAINILTTGQPGDFPDIGEYEFAIALVDAYGNESKLSNKIIKTITNTAHNLEFKVKFDPNATGFKVYARLTSQPSLYLFYDSTAEAILKEDLPNSNITSEIIIGSEGATFPKSGVVLIGNEYIKYNNIDKDLDNNSVPFYKLNGTEFSRNVVHRGRESVLGAHTAGDKVVLVNEGFLQQDSPTACVSGIWRFPTYTVDSNFVWRFNFVAKDFLKYRTELVNKTPKYSEDLPANYTSENITFRIEMSDKLGLTNVDSLDKVPNAGRVMITTGYEAF